MKTAQEKVIEEYIAYITPMLDKLMGVSDGNRRMRNLNMLTSMEHHTIESNIVQIEGLLKDILAEMGVEQ